MSDRWTSLRVDELPSIKVAGDLRWKPVRRTLGIEAFGMNAYTGEKPGDDVVERHSEETLRHEEVYVVLSGRASFELDGETLDAPAGTIVFLRDPTVRRYATAAEPHTTVLAVGGKPGEAYTPSAWEWYFEAQRFPDHPGVIYSTACWEALDGRPDYAGTTLQRAIELDPRSREWALRDEDLASIHDRISAA